jgi:hypothetical protein
MDASMKWFVVGQVFGMSSIVIGMWIARGRR